MTPAHFIASAATLDPAAEQGRSRGICIEN